MTTSHTRTVLLTDHAWPDDAVERAVIESAGFLLVAGPSVPAPTGVIEALVADYHPAAVLTCRAPVSATAIAAAAPNLAIVARIGVGLDNIAVEAASAHGVWVTNVPDHCVAEAADVPDSSDSSVVELRRRAAEEVVRVLRGLPPTHPCNTPIRTSAVRAAR